MKLCILIPAFNEEGRIGKVVQGARQFGDVVVVDDGSLDGTAKEAEGTGAHVIQFPENCGKGTAIQAGFSYFLKAEWDGIILLDGDGQHDPKEISRFIDVSRDESIEMWVGDRMSSSQDMPLIRRWTNFIMSKILSLLVGIHVPDTQCGFRFLRRSLVERIRLQASRFDIESEILFEAARFTSDIRSVPITSIYREEKSKIRPLRDTIRFLKLIMRVLKIGRK